MQFSKKVADDYAQLFWLLQQNAELKKRRILVNRLRDTEILRPSDAVGNIIVAFAPVLAKPGVAVIGSTAFCAYSNNYGLTAVSNTLSATKDVDVLCAHATAQEGPPKTPENMPTRVSADNKASLDFLTPRRVYDNSASNSEERKHFIWISRLQTYAHALPANRSLLMRELVTVAIPHDSGVLVRVPEPIHFALHKLVVGQERSNPEKARKDSGQATVTLEHAVVESTNKLDKIVREFATYGNGILVKPLKRALEECKSSLPAFHAWRRHAIKNIIPALDII